MNAIMQFFQTTVGPLVFIFTVSNLAAMGLKVKIPEVIVALRNKKSMALIFVWGWVLGPALGYLITWALPLAEPYKVVVLLASLAPCAPFLQQMVGKARGDMGFAGALIPLVAVGTVVLMPLMAPRVDQRSGDQHLVARETALPDYTPAAGDRSHDPALRRQGRNQDVPGNQGISLDLHIADDRVVPGHLRPSDAQHGG